jgi:hypothetical protein
MIFTWLTDEELREIGWEEEHIQNGLVGQVAAFFFVKDKDDVYNVRRNFMPRTYDCDEDDLSRRGVGRAYHDLDLDANMTAVLQFLRCSRRNDQGYSFYNSHHQYHFSY